MGFFDFLYKCCFYLGMVGGILLGTTQNAVAQRALIKMEEVEIYTLPMVDNSPITVLTKGDTISVIGQRGDWVKIEIAKGKKGWMRLQVEKPGSTKRVRLHDSPAPLENGVSKGHHFGTNGATGNGKATNGENSGEQAYPDPIIKKSPVAGKQVYRRFGYSFGGGLLESDFTYYWKFVFHQTPRLALVGSFKHALGEAANSYFIMANLSYFLKKDVKSKFLPYLTGGMGVINTVPERSIDTGGVSNMAINYGFGARKYYKNQLSILFSVSQYSVFIGKNVSHFKEITIGLLVGKFWD